MKKSKFLILLILIISFSSNSCDDETPNIDGMEDLELGSITGFVRLSTEYGLHPFGEEGTITVYLTNSKDEITSIQTNFDDRRFEFDSLEQGRYSLRAESSTYKSCEIFEFEISKEKLFYEKELGLKSIDFTAILNSVEFDSLVGGFFYHSFDIEKENDKTLGVRFYFSNEPNVSNQNYIETALNLAAWASPETSGQYRLRLEITPELYEGDSIYVSTYLLKLRND